MRTIRDDGVGIRSGGCYKVLKKNVFYFSNVFSSVTLFLGCKIHVYVYVVYMQEYP